MKYIIDTEVLEKNNLSLTEFGVLLFYAGGGEGIIQSSVCENLWKKGYLIKDVNSYCFDSFKFEELQTILAEGSNKKSENKRAEELAPQIRSLFPEGYKIVLIGNIQKKYPWRDSDRVIANRMKVFFKRYGKKYSNEEILNAVKNYVSSFNGNYSYMRVLKYFIWKDEVKINADGDKYVDEVSDLANWIENMSTETCNNSEWTANLK